MQIGQELALRCGHEGNPPRPVATLDIHLKPEEERQGPGDPGDVHWLLFAALARASGRDPRRQLAGGERMLLMVALDVARIGAVARGVALDAALLPNSNPASGRNALLVEPHEVSRLLALQLLELAGMLVKVAGSIEQAVSSLDLERHLPDVLLISFGVEEPACRTLIDTLRARQPGLRVVELVDDDNAFAFSVPGTDLPARVGRHTLERALVAAITQELDTA